MKSMLNCIVGPTVLVLLTMACNFARAGTVTTTPAYQTASNGTNYIFVKPNDPPIQVTINWDSGDVNPDVEAGSASIADDPSSDPSSNQIVKDVTLSSDALGAKTEMTVTIHHTDDDGSPCPTPSSPLTIEIFQPYVESVSFDGDDGEYLELTSDDGNTNYSAPQWMDPNGNGDPDDDGGNNYGIAYVVGSSPEIGVKLKVGDISCLGSDSITLEGDGSDGVHIPETTVTQTNDEISIDPTTADSGFPDQVKFYNEADSSAFTLNWSIGVGGNGADLPATNHTIYTTLRTPVTSSRQETLVYVATKYAAGDTTGTSDSDVTSHIWNAFDGASTITKADGTTPLYYYAKYTTNADTTALLLSGGDGTCQAWTRFFLDLRKFEGIQDDPSVNNLIGLYPAPTVANLILVKNWDFQPVGHSANPTFPFLNIFPNANPTAWVAATGYFWIDSDVDQGDGIAGQNNNSPSSLFSFHEIVSVNGQLYDPSYGTIRPNTAPSFLDGLAAFNHATLDETKYHFDINGNNIIEKAADCVVIVIQTLPAGFTFTPQPSHY